MRFDLRDGMALGGLGMMFAGLWLWIGLGTALTVCGALLLAAGIWSSWHGDVDTATED